VGLAVTDPTAVTPRKAGRAPGAMTALLAAALPRVQTGFALDAPETADRLLAAAASRGDYAAAVAHLYGCGFSRYAGTFPTVMGEPFPALDLWALVVYDERRTGPRRAAAVLYGDRRHVTAALTRPVPQGAEPVAAEDAVRAPGGRPAELAPGYVPPAHVGKELVGLFVLLSVGADLRF
jgi:hypothetical protein